MKSAAFAVTILVIVASGGLGYYIGTFSRADVSNASSTTSSDNNFVAYPLSIVSANWTNQYTAVSGYCGVAHMSNANPGSGVVNEGPPYATCDVPIRGNESGTITLVVANSWSKTGIAFEAVSSVEGYSDPSEVYFLNPQGCPSPGGLGFCGYAGADSDTSFNFTWVSDGFTGTKNVTFEILLGVMSPS